MAQLYDPFHPCPMCKQPTYNESWCDNCIDRMAFNLVWRYEADMRPKPKPLAVLLGIHYLHQPRIP